MQKGQHIHKYTELPNYRWPYKFALKVNRDIKILQFYSSKGLQRVKQQQNKKGKKIKTTVCT